MKDAQLGFSKGLKSKWNPTKLNDDLEDIMGKRQRKIERKQQKKEGLQKGFKNMTMILPNKDKDSFGTISPKSEVGNSPLPVDETDDSYMRSSKAKTF